MSGHVCDGVDHAVQLIDARDWGGLLAGTLRSMNGERCRCPVPILHGRDLMCGCCLLRNEGQEAALVRLMSEPHPFEADLLHKPGSVRARMCALCSRWDTDQRHVAAPAEEGGRA